MNRRVGVLMAVAALLQGCTTTRYAKVRLLSEPDLAYVRILDTGLHLGSTPTAAVIESRIWFWQRHADYQLLFEKRGLCDEVVHLRIAGVWRKTRQEAEVGPDVVSIFGLLATPPCSDVAESSQVQVTLSSSR